jgi:hypothetical protein
MLPYPDYADSYTRTGHSAMDYTPFGEPISLSKSQSREKYIGKETDFESGLARVYDTKIHLVYIKQIMYFIGVVKFL